MLSIEPKCWAIFSTRNSELRSNDEYSNAVHWIHQQIRPNAIFIRSEDTNEIVAATWLLDIDNIPLVNQEAR